MRIGFDAKRYFENRTGLGNFSRTLINDLIEHYPEHDYFLYTSSKPSSKHITKCLDISKIKIRYPKSGSANYYRTRGILRDIVEDKLDIYHGLSNELPFGIHKTSTKTVVTIHDLIFKDIPEDYQFVDRMIYDWKAKYACNNANLIHSISQATRDSIMQHYLAKPEKIEVAYQNIDPFYYALDSQQDDSLLLEMHEIETPYILFVGNAMVRKNLISILRAMLQMDVEINLVLVLSEQQLPPHLQSIIESNNLDNRIKQLNNINQKLLKALYKNALALIYPSIAEGWGIPIEEAIACNTHAIVPNYAPFNERFSPLKVHVNDPKDEKSLAEEVLRIFRKKGEKLNEYEQIVMLAKEMIIFYNRILKEPLLGSVK